MESIEILRQFRAAGVGVTLWRDNTACCAHQATEGQTRIALQNYQRGRDGQERPVNFYSPADLARLRVVLDLVEDILRSEDRLAVVELIEQAEESPLVVEWDFRGKGGEA